MSDVHKTGSKWVGSGLIATVTNIAEAKLIADITIRSNERIFTV